MGDPRKTRKKYETPRHPWIASRIEDEKTLRRQYGTANKKELWKMDSALKKFKDQAKTLSGKTGSQAELEHQQMMNKLVSLNLVKPGATLDDILSLSIHDIMNRRLQTVLVKKLLARTPKQARQFIVHGHVAIGDKIVTSPSYLVTQDEEARITFIHSSPFLNDQHPERLSEEELQRKADKKEEKKVVEKKEEAPTFENVEDPEEATSVKKVTEVKVEKKVEATENKAEVKVEKKVEATENKAEDSKKEADKAEVKVEKKVEATENKAEDSKKEADKAEVTE